MLSGLLDSFAALDIPPGCSVRFLIVENDDAPRSAAAVERRGWALPAGPLHHVLEPEPGIPFARNRAAREALAAGHDLLAFVDDDEVVAQDWLVRLVAGYRESGAALIGAPLYVMPPAPGLGWLQRRMHDCIARRHARKASRKGARASLSGTPGVNIVTNNWLAETSVFGEHGIWFDETMRFTGGTDAKFSVDVKDAGLPTAWVHDALAYEIIPPDRLSFRYQFDRARAQSTTTFRRKIDRRPASRWSVLFTVPVKSVQALLLTLSVIPSNGRTLLDLAHACGWIAGRIGATFGARSRLYETTTGG